MIDISASSNKSKIGQSPGFAPAALKKSQEVHQDALAFDIKHDPIFESLRDNPRFQDLLRRVGLPL